MCSMSLATLPSPFQGTTGNLVGQILRYLRLWAGSYLNSAAISTELSSPKIAKSVVILEITGKL